MAGVVSGAAAAPGATAQDILVAAARAAPLAALRKFIAVRTAGSTTHGGVCIQTAVVHTFLRELRGMPLFAAVAPALPPPRTASSGSLDEVTATNCYTPGPGGEGCCGPAAGQCEAGAGQQTPEPACALQVAQQQEEQRLQHQATGDLQHSQQQQAAGDPQPAQQQHAQQQHLQQQRSESHDSLAATAAASSSPALAASSAEPAVREDLSRERACMLLLMAPREVWRQIGDERLRGEVMALLDTGAHAGEASSWRCPSLLLLQKLRHLFIILAVPTGFRGGGVLVVHGDVDVDFDTSLCQGSVPTTATSTLSRKGLSSLTSLHSSLPLPPARSGGGRGGVSVGAAVAATNHAAGAGGKRSHGAHLRAACSGDSAGQRR